MTLTEMRAKMEAAKSRFKGMKEKADNVMDKTFAAAETGGAAFLSGAIQGYNGEDVKVAGLPLDLVVSVAAHGYGFMSGSKHADHVHNIGNGFLAGYACKAGQRMGAKAKENKQKTGSMFGAEHEPAQLTTGRVYGERTAIQPATMVPG